MQWTDDLGFGSIHSQFIGTHVPHRQSWYHYRWQYWGLPRLAVNLVSAMMHASLSKPSTTSIRTARVVKEVNIQHQLFMVLRKNLTSHGTKWSIPVFWKGYENLFTLPFGRSAISVYWLGGNFFTFNTLVLNAAWSFSMTHDPEFLLKNTANILSAPMIVVFMFFFSTSLYQEDASLKAKLDASLVGSIQKVSNGLSIGWFLPHPRMDTFFSIYAEHSLGYFASSILKALERFPGAVTLLAWGVPFHQR